MAAKLDYCRVCGVSYRSTKCRRPLFSSSNDAITSTLSRIIKRPVEADGLSPTVCKSCWKKLASVSRLEKQLEELKSWLGESHRRTSESLSVPVGSASGAPSKRRILFSPSSNQPTPKRMDSSSSPLSPLVHKRRFLCSISTGIFHPVNTFAFLDKTTYLCLCVN